MGQKVNPISNRLGVIRGGDSNWFGGKKYGDTLLEDSKIRKYLNVRLAKSSVSRIVIERTLKLSTITVCTSRPGQILRKGLRPGKGVDHQNGEGGGAQQQTAQVIPPGGRGRVVHVAGNAPFITCSIQ